MNIRFFREIGGIDIAGAEARVDLIGFSGMTEEAAEKLETWGEVRKIEIAGAEARVDSIGFSGSTEVVPCYTACSEGFFASCEVVSCHKARSEGVFSASIEVGAFPTLPHREIVVGRLAW